MGVIRIVVEYPLKNKNFIINVTKIYLINFCIFYSLLHFFYSKLCEGLLAGNKTQLDLSGSLIKIYFIIFVKNTKFKGKYKIDS